MSTLRSQMLRIASELPQGDPTRRKLLATLADKTARRYDTKLEALEAGVADLKNQIASTEKKIKELSEIASSLGPKVINVWLKKDKAHLAERKSLLREVQKELDEERKKGKTAAPKEAGSDAVLWQIIDQRGFYKLYNEMEDANDDSSASMLREISDKLAKSLELSGNEQQALGRLRRCVDAQGKWDPALQRNNIFKAADLLGIRLPHGMF